ncbi:Ig-like domain-containing protein [Puniceicoccaceae bacterium K14]|nr:Ig-like domain-containing protein [Puniceicoccaceae bacterium K14]
MMFRLTANLRFGYMKLCASLCILTALIIPTLKAGIGDIDADGWTELEPSIDSRVIYVSSSTGDDSNDGLTPGTALNSIDSANKLMRDGYPDWMLLKRDDTFLQPVLGTWKSGRNEDEPMVISYYGDSGQRPLIKLTDSFIDWNGTGRSNIALVGIDFYGAISDPSSAEFTNESCGVALRLLNLEGDASNILIEDCLFRYCWLVTQGSDSSFINNFNLRRSSVSNTWTHGSTTSHDGRIQGIYIQHTADIVFEENVFHHCGWSEEIEDANANQYNHNIYMSTTNGGDILVRGNVLSFGAAQGLQLRSGGITEMNAFIGNSVGMNIGYSTYPVYYTSDTFVRKNVITDARQQVPYLASEPQTGAVWGIWRRSIDNIYVDDNIVSNEALTVYESIFRRAYVEMEPNDYGAGNIAWNFDDKDFPATDPGWLDPDRDAESFAASLGFSSYNEWVEHALMREVGTMPFDATAYSYVNYIREGFNKAPISAPYNYSAGLGSSVVVEPVSSIHVVPPSLSIAKGSTQLLTAFTYPSNTDLETFSWTSSNPLVATVDVDGFLTANSQGAATIEATSSDSGLVNTSDVTVVDFGSNVALNKPVEYSMFLGTSELLVDGSTNDADRWTGQNFPQWAKIDLGVDYDLKSFRLYPFVARDYQYTISVAVDGSDSYQVVVDRSANAETGSVLIDDIEATGRYIYLEVTGAATYGGSYISINELEIYGTGGADPIPVTGVSLSANSQTVPVGDAFDLDAIIYPADAGETTVAWTTSDPSVANVRSDGYVETFGIGTATITATTIDGQYSDSAIVEVMDLGPNVAIDRPVSVLSGNGFKLVDGNTSGDYRWSAETFPQTAEIDLGANYDISAFRLFPLSERDYQYTISASTSGSDVFQTVVDRSGNSETGAVFTNLVNAKGRTVRLTVLGAATYTGPWASINELEVYGSISNGGPAVTGVSIEPSPLVMQIGEINLLEAIIEPYDANNALVDWSSDDETIAAVDKSGVVSGMSIGSTKIHVTTRDGGYSAEVDVEVEPRPYRAGSESFDNLTASTTDRFDSGSYIGDNGNEWTYYQVMLLTDPTNIEGNTAQVRRFTGSVVTTLEDGLNTLRFSIQTLPGDSSTGFGKLEVFIDGESQGEFQPAAINEPTEFVLTDLGKVGSVELEFNGNGWGEVMLDNVSWNRYADVNGDGTIDRADMNMIRMAMNSQEGDENYLEHVDFDSDGRITRNDYNQWYRLARSNQ